MQKKNCPAQALANFGIFREHLPEEKNVSSEKMDQKQYEYELPWDFRFATYQENISNEMKRWFLICVEFL